MNPSNTPWLSMGPFNEKDFFTKTDLGVGGRVTAIAFIENFQGGLNPAMFIGTAGGGVWRSDDFQNKNPTWTPLTDNLIWRDPTAKIPLEDSRKVGLLDITNRSIK